MQPTAPADRPSRFPLIFEVLIWGLYVSVYKYSFYLEEAARQHRPAKANFPFPQLMLFALLATLYVLPWYRWLVPHLLRQRRYALLAVGSLLYLWWGIKLNTWLAALLFSPVAVPPVLADFYHFYAALTPAQLLGIQNPVLGLLLTDMLAFGCVAFVRAAFEQEARRRLLERDHLALQLTQLKSQLQPHFLFNTLNSIYGLSLTGSPETPRFILLLSELMRYVLYDSGREYIALPEEITFLENYFEMEQRKYAGARIHFTATGAAEAGGLQVPPLLLLPLVENSFKHGRHHFSDKASVEASLTATSGRLHFVIENDMLPEMPAAAPSGKRSGGIGLVNIRQRLQLYYPNAHELVLSERDGRYRAELTLQV
ncbi:sensor histidine kinase [Hymenobacter sp. DH14]|uniref:Sensor histidine kinase n=1 Tax=Hymenobacter cyanobacteriorum TaxID=2926463 RepID=A0A9X2AE12_9BACT|nr:sensor histidine kinase [Hymenobacter cyanobacteriorum]MCI1186756.1 sensor histidine kinase [Hymenobacter cyanobacteriorum]